MAQGTNGAECFRRELNNARRAACEKRWNELRGEHGKKRMLSFEVEQVVVNGFVAANAQLL
jgi:hypothetical protein